MPPSDGDLTHRAVKQMKSAVMRF